ncbi:uncharacterized protein LOC144352794 [Saccoglossus kowalevskii]
MAHFLSNERVPYHFRITTTTVFEATESVYAWIFICKQAGNIANMRRRIFFALLFLLVLNIRGEENQLTQDLGMEASREERQLSMYGWWRIPFKSTNMQRVIIFLEKNNDKNRQLYHQFKVSMNQ